MEPRLFVAEEKWLNFTADLVEVPGFANGVQGRRIGSGKVVFFDNVQNVIYVYLPAVKPRTFSVVGKYLNVREVPLRESIPTGAIPYTDRQNWFRRFWIIRMILSWFSG
jgi:hypothetical protein